VVQVPPVGIPLFN